MKPIVILLCLLIFGIVGNAQEPLYEVNKSKVSFTSEAPLELIYARSTRLIGFMDVANRQFAFKVSISSFDGFNNAMQKGHFNENYMDSDVYPYATFIGKIIESVNVNVPGNYDVRAKGKLSIHGTSQERILNVKMKINASGAIDFYCKFDVELANHDIKIPKVVTEKLSPDVWVEVSGQMTKKK